MVVSRSKIEWLGAEGVHGYAINPFIGCAHGCTYCWSRRLRRISAYDWVRPQLSPSFMGISVRAAVGSMCPWEGNILLSATSDIFQPEYLGYEGIIDGILRGLAWVKNGKTSNARVWVLTKSGSGILDHMEQLVAINAKVGVTLTSLDWNVLEPGAELPRGRITGLEEAKRRGLETFISIEPIIPEVTDPVAIIERTREFTDLYILGSLNYQPTPEGYYTAALPTWEKALEGLNYYVKKELRKRGDFYLGTGRDASPPVMRSDSGGSQARV